MSCRTLCGMNISQLLCFVLAVLAVLAVSYLIERFRKRGTLDRLGAIASTIGAHFALPAFATVRDKLRGLPLLLIFIATLWLIAIPNPLLEDTNKVKVGLIAWLICKESILAYLGYWIDRLLHPNSRPGNLKDIERMAAEKRRAFIVCAAMLAGGLFQ